MQRILFKCKHVRRASRLVSSWHRAVAFAQVETEQLQMDPQGSVTSWTPQCCHLDAVRVTGKSSSLFSISNTKVSFHLANVTQFDGSSHEVTTESQRNGKLPEQGLLLSWRKVFSLEAPLIVSPQQVSSC